MQYNKNKFLLLENSLAFNSLTLVAWVEFFIHYFNFFNYFNFYLYSQVYYKYKWYAASTLISIGLTFIHLLLEYLTCLKQISEAVFSCINHFFIHFHKNYIEFWFQSIFLFCKLLKRFLLWFYNKNWLGNYYNLP